MSIVQTLLHLRALLLRRLLCVACAAVDPQHFDWAKQLLDSSALGSATYFKDVQDEGTFINHRPYYNSSTPLSLMCSAFGRFLAAYQAESPTGADYGVAMSLCEVLSQVRAVAPPFHLIHGRVP